MRPAPRFRSAAAQTGISFQTGYQSDLPRNRILFGAPGTGKSFTLNREKDTLLAAGGEYERVTFHPDYSYANFVGTYKPVPYKDIDGKDAITYSYVPGPFMRIYVKALQNSRSDTPKPFLLVIEELNRANVSAVFGDVFQLLDRGEDAVSEYPIQASEDIKKYLVRELHGSPDDYTELRIPDNMFIWATLIPDLISIVYLDGVCQFIIFDAKYYNLQLEHDKKLRGQPGIESITKHSIYKKAGSICPLRILPCPPFWAGISLSASEPLCVAAAAA